MATGEAGSAVRHRGCRALLDALLDCLRAVPSDARLFRWWQLSVLAAFACVSVLFSLVDFNHFVHPDWQRPLTYWDESAGMDSWRRAFMMISSIVAFSGVLCVVLITVGGFSSWFWGLINSVTYGLYAFAFGYSGSAQLYIVFFVPMQIYGAYEWHREIDREGRVKARSLGWLGWTLCIFSTGIISACLFYEIPAFSVALVGSYYFDPTVIHTYVPQALDALSCGLNVVAQMLCVWRYWEQWVFWILVDCVAISMWTGVNGYGIDFNILLMWCAFLVNAVFGLFLWFDRSRQAQVVKREEGVSQVRFEQAPSPSHSVPKPKVTVGDLLSLA